MVDCHPSKSIVNLGSANRSTMFPRGDNLQCHPVKNVILYNGIWCVLIAKKQGVKEEHMSPYIEYESLLCYCRKVYVSLIKVF